MNQHPHPPFMQAALAEASAALELGNLPIGAAIVHGDDVIALGRNAIDAPGDDTRHAELSAIQSVAPFLYRHKRQCALYTTLEPCMMCLGAIINVGIECLVIGAADAAIGGLQLVEHADYYRSKRGQMTIIAGYMAQESRMLLDAYIRRTGFRRHLASDRIDDAPRLD